MLARLHRTLQIPGLEMELKPISQCDVTVIVAERYRSSPGNGRVFLVGDAAHRIPPWGALNYTLASRMCRLWSESWLQR